MRNPHIQPGQVVEVNPLEMSSDSGRVTPIVKTEAVEIVRLFIPAGETVPTYEAQGEIILHCLEGSVRLTALETPRELSAGKLVYLVVQEPFSLLGIENSVLLVTVLTPRRGQEVELVGKM